MINIGIIGSGYMAKGFLLLANDMKDVRISAILTRSVIKTRTDINQSLLTNNLESLIHRSDIILECSGNTIHATKCFDIISQAHIPVVTLNSEFHITCGHHFYDHMKLFEGEGDQSGCIHKLNTELEDMGFTPLVYGNYKKYLNHNVSKRQAMYWSNKNKVSLDKTIAFTDGTKVEIENTLVANSLDAWFYEGETIDEANKLDFLTKKSIEDGKRYVDYFIDKKAPAGIFIATHHNENQKQYLNYLGFKGPYQVIERGYHFCHLEIYKSIKNAFVEGSFNDHTQMRNTRKRYMVASLTKKSIKGGTHIKNGFGSVEFRGFHHKYNKDIVPITLLENVVVDKDLPENHILTFDDIKYVDNLATSIWREHV